MGAQLCRTEAPREMNRHLSSMTDDFVAILVLLSGTARCPAAELPLSLENGKTRIVLDARGGGFASWIDKQTGIDFLQPDPRAALYDLVFWDAARKPVQLNEHNASKTAINVSRTAAAQVLTISTTGHGGRDIDVKAECELPEDTAALTCRIHVVNRTPLSLFSVRFPALRLKPQLGPSSADDRLLLPKCDGLLVVAPQSQYPKGRYDLLQYPGNASLQLLAFYDGSAGIYGAALDSAGYRKQVGFNRDQAGIGMLFLHYPAVKANTNFDLPYPVSVGVFHGDWQTAAGIYKRWAATQTWCSTMFSDRSDIPDWLKSPFFSYQMNLRGDLPEGGVGSRVALVPEIMHGYAQRLEAPVTAILHSWEKLGAWVTPDYFPPLGGDEAFSEMNARLLAQGDRSMVFLSGLRWTLRRTRPDPLSEADHDDTVRFAREGEPYAIVGEDGRVQRIGQPSDDVGEYAQICPYTPYARKMLTEAAVRLAELGVTAVQVDQIVGGGLPPCYSATHGHPVGGGNWMYEALRDLFQAVRAEGRTRNAEFVLSVEGPGEVYMPYLDTYHARDSAEGRWPRDVPGSVGVPLFTHVYHEYLPGYGGPPAEIYSWSNPQAVLTTAFNLVHGKSSVASVYPRYLSASQVYSEQMEMLLESIRMMQTPAKDYLLFGQRLAMPPLEAPGVIIPVWIPLKPSEPRVFPSVLSSGWGLADGRLGYIVVSQDNAEQQVQIPLGYGLEVEGRFRLSKIEGGVEEALAEGFELPIWYNLTLKPRRAVFLELQAE